jgi:type I restriction-modification system DNA methylase subunit
VEILGSIYEKFLGKTIHLTAKTTRIEEKPEVRKAGGVYYTPQYIVKYIVANTLGKLLYEEDEQPSEGHSESKRPSEGNKKLKLSPKQVAKLKIIDIACGSGSFLLGAFQELIDYHLAWYAAHPKDIETKNNVPDAMPDANGNLHLSARKKRDILVNNIYGVDIDRQAVEVTQMSLYLKVLENENAETLNPQMTLALKEVYLPSMANNIKCGNSLIGTDFTAQGDLFNDEARRKVNPFDWEMEFPEILGTSKEPHPNPPLLGEGRERLQSRGFDVVIGNPPYVRQESLGENFKRYVCGRYKCFIGTADLYIYFIEKAHTILSNGGYYGMICSGKFMRTSYGEPLRKFISTNSSIQEIIDFGELPVFESASTFPIVIITKNGKTKSQQFKFTQVKSLEFDSLWEVTNQSYTILDNSSLDPNGWTLASEDVVRLINKIKSKGVTLGKYLQGNIYRGVLTGLNEAFLIDELTRKKIVSKDRKAERLIKRFVVGDDVRKYRIRDSKTFIIMIPNGWTRKEMIKGKDKWKSFGAVYPSIASHLKPFITKAQKRIDKGEYWWELRPCDYYSEMEKPKIIWPEIAKESRFSFDDSSYFPNKTCFFSVSSDKYLLGILNSQTIWFILKNYCSILGDVQNGGRLLQQKIYIEQLPIRTIDFTNPAEKKIHDNLVALVEKMLTLNKELQGKNFDSEKEPIQRQIAATDKKIDSLVYELYGLTEEEIKIVENKE